jgi:adenylylsulfate kinase-like enzyme
MASLVREQYSVYKSGKISVGTVEGSLELGERYEAIILIGDGTAEISLNDNLGFIEIKANEQIKIPITVTKIFHKASAATTVRYITLK